MFARRRAIWQAAVIWGHCDMRVIGWDVGGAHLKAALAEDGRILGVVQLACPLWLGMQHLETALAAAKAELGPADRHAATMTGELADIFADRTAGVAAIAAVLGAACQPGPLQIYTPHGLVDWGEAERQAAQVASANWHATAALVGRFMPDALLIDIGSTTTDLVPVSDGFARPSGMTDAARLASGELVYTGLTRTSLMAVSRCAPFAGGWTPLACEHFATMADVHRILGELPQKSDLHPSADGRDKSVAASRSRLARMVGRDAGDAPEAAWHNLAAWFAEAQLRAVTDAAMLVQSRAAVMPAAPVVAAGAGRHLAARLAARLGRPCVDFADLPLAAAGDRAKLAICAPAVAMALLPDSRAD
jgi:probable H4MPT-linked C1 transfer pathway protein